MFQFSLDEKEQALVQLYRQLDHLQSREQCLRAILEAQIKTAVRVKPKPK